MQRDLGANYIEPAEERKSAPRGISPPNPSPSSRKLRVGMARHIFVSYVRENSDTVEKLANQLELHGLKVWLDRKEISPGTRWRDAIREAIRKGALFLACFSAASAARERSYMNEELTLAIDELRQRPMDRTWFVPVLLVGGDVPQRSISSNETLRDLQWLDLASDWEAGVKALIGAASKKGLHRSETRKPSSSRRILSTSALTQPQVRKATIFLSHPHKAYAQGAALRRSLIADFVISEFQPALGSIVQEEIKLQIARADYFLAIWAPDSRWSGDVSPWLPYELGLAVALNKPTLVVVLKGVREGVGQRIQGSVLAASNDDFDLTIGQVVQYCKNNWKLTKSADVTQLQNLEDQV